MHVHMEYCYEQLRKFEMVDSDGDEEIVLPEMQCIPKDLACALGSAKRSLLETLEKAESDKKMKTQEEKYVKWGPTLSSRPTTRKHGNINIMDKAKAYLQNKNLEIPKSFKGKSFACLDIPDLVSQSDKIDICIGSNEKEKNDILLDMIKSEH